MIALVRSAWQSVQQRSEEKAGGKSTGQKETPIQATQGGREE